jgi:hypothetical protein
MSIECLEPTEDVGFLVSGHLNNSRVTGNKQCEHPRKTRTPVKTGVKSKAKLQDEEFDPGSG